jgi:hypothetical protein
MAMALHNGTKTLLISEGKLSKANVLKFNLTDYADDYAARKKYIHIPIEYY